MTPLVPPCRPLTVLVVDDVRDAADSLGDLLSLCGCQTRMAYDGEDALRMAAAGPPDAVVLDLAMPGMDGWELARRLGDASRWKRPLLIAVSGCGDGAARRRSGDAGIDLHLVKPVEPAVIVGVLQRFAQVLGAEGPDLFRSRVTPDDCVTWGGRPVRSPSSE
jgi:CheY-like chemotaxis protein